jgi:hypothetical protein
MDAVLSGAAGIEGPGSNMGGLARRPLFGAALKGEADERWY